jgi:ABC-type amino acid transport system permease subunit
VRGRAAAAQLFLLAAVAFVVWYLASNTVQNLEARRIASGFGFLSREAGFEIGETPFLAYSAADNYARVKLWQHTVVAKDGDPRDLAAVHLAVGIEQTHYLVL